MQLNKHPAILTKTWEENVLFLHLKFRCQLPSRPAQLLQQPKWWSSGNALKMVTELTLLSNTESHWKSTFWYPGVPDKVGEEDTLLNYPNRTETSGLWANTSMLLLETQLKVKHHSTFEKQTANKKKKWFNSHDTELKDKLILIRYSRHEEV